MSYTFWQCLDEACHFRFPASAAEAGAILCPRCRGLVAVAVEAVEGRLPPEEAPHDGPVLVALLDNIRSVHNVGSIFRSADGARVSHLHLAGITATPDHPKLAKAALGAQETVAWTYHTNGVDAANALKAEGYQLWALERLSAANRPSLYPMGETVGRLALVVGNERAGVDPGILALCDAVISLPMAGQKSSLNAAVAFGIGIYYLRFGTGLIAGSGRASEEAPLLD
jgi:tRNA G18 (ribose-2'-O)-methylase SpoU